MRMWTLLMPLVVMAILSPLAGHCQEVSATERTTLLETLLFRQEMQVTFSITFDTFTSTLPPPEITSKQLAAHPGDPHLEFVLAESLSNVDRGEEAKPHYAAVVEAYRHKAASTPPSSNETAEWAKATEMLSDTESGIRIAERALAAHSPAPLPIYRYLSNACMTVAVSSCLGITGKNLDLSSVAAAAVALVSGEENTAVIAAGRQTLDKGLQYANRALAEPNPLSEDYATRMFYECVCELMAIWTRAHDEHLDPGTQPTKAFGKVFQSAYFAKACELKGSDPAKQASFAVFRLFGKVGVDAFTDAPDGLSEATKQAVADEKALLIKLIREAKSPLPEAYDALALIAFMSAGPDSPEALDAAAKALAISPCMNTSFIVVTSNLQTQSRWQEAIDLCARRVKADHSEEAYRSLVTFDARAGRLAEAEQTAREAFARPAGKQDPRMQLLLGSVLLKQGKVAESIGLLESAFTADGTNAIAAYHLAIAYYLTGKTPDARKALEAARAHPLSGTGAEEFNANVDKLWERITPHDAAPPQ